MPDEIKRLCGFCLTPMPVSELEPGGTQCADPVACRARADAKFLYPLGEGQVDAALAAREMQTGRPQVTHRPASMSLPELAGPMTDRDAAVPFSATGPNQINPAHFSPEPAPGPLTAAEQEELDRLLAKAAGTGQPKPRRAARQKAGAR